MLACLIHSIDSIVPCSKKRTSVPSEGTPKHEQGRGTRFPPARMEEAARAKDARDMEEVGVSELAPQHRVDDAMHDEAAVKDVDEDDEEGAKGTATTKNSKRKREEEGGPPGHVEDEVARPPLPAVRRSNEEDEDEDEDEMDEVEVEDTNAGHDNAADGEAEDEDGVAEPEQHRDDDETQGSAENEEIEEEQESVITIINYDLWAKQDYEENMKRRSTVEGEESGQGGNNHNRLNNNDNNNKRKKNKQKHRPHPPPDLGTVATRTRHQQKAIASTWQQPITILIHIMSYADPETIRMLCCVSQQFYDLITHNPGMEQNRVIPLLQISPSEEKGDAGRLERLLKQLVQNQNRVHHIREVKVMGDGYNFLYKNEIDSDRDRLIETLRQRFTGVVALDLSSPTITSFPYANDYFLWVLKKMLPNLQEINLSNLDLQSYQLENVFKTCSRLEKITCNHNSDQLVCHPQTYMDGKDMSPAKNLTELYMDGSQFFAWGALLKKLSDLENDKYSDIFLFHKCGKGLERVSIKNAKYKIAVRCRTTSRLVWEIENFPQNVLIKFVRNTPTLKWLRSDLTQDNIEMLRSEQEQRFSKIKFVQ